MCSSGLHCKSFSLFPMSVWLGCWYCKVPTIFWCTCLERYIARPVFPVGISRQTAEQTSRSLGRPIAGLMTFLCLILSSLLLYWNQTDGIILSLFVWLSIVIIDWRPEIGVCRKDIWRQLGRSFPPIQLHFLSIGTSEFFLRKISLGQWVVNFSKQALKN